MICSFLLIKLHQSCAYTFVRSINRVLSYIQVLHDCRLLHLFLSCQFISCQKWIFKVLCLGILDQMLPSQSSFQDRSRGHRGYAVAHLGVISSGFIQFFDSFHMLIRLVLMVWINIILDDHFSLMRMI